VRVAETDHCVMFDGIVLMDFEGRVLEERTMEDRKIRVKRGVCLIFS
jgi:hypothetical protein